MLKWLHASKMQEQTTTITTDKNSRCSCLTGRWSWPEMPKLNYFRKWNQGILKGVKTHKCHQCWQSLANSFTFPISARYPVLTHVVSSGKHQEVSGVWDTSPLPPGIEAGHCVPPVGIILGLFHTLQHPHGDTQPAFSTGQVQNTSRLPLLLSLPPFHAGDNLQRAIDA